MTEKHSLSVGNTTLKYTVIRSERRKKTVSMMWDPQEGLIIKAPLTTQIETLEGMARKRIYWLMQMRDSRQQEAGPMLKEMVNGETLQYLGRNYRLRIHWNSKRNDCKLQAGWFDVHTTENCTGNQETFWELIESWYKKQAKARIPERVQHYASQVNLQPNNILIRSQEKRWASCDSQGNLRFNWRIMMAPLTLIDYVVAHELCHLMFPNHSQDFWDLLWTLMPDYALRRERLKLLGTNFTL